MFLTIKNLLEAQIHEFLLNFKLLRNFQTATKTWGHLTADSNVSLKSLLIEKDKTRFFKKPLSDRGKKTSPRKYTPEQESLIDQNMKANPGYSREEIVKALNL